MQVEGVSLTSGPSSQPVEQVLKEIQAERSRNTAKSSCRDAYSYSCGCSQAELSWIISVPSQREERKPKD